MTDATFWSGRNARFKFVMDNKSLEFLCKTWKVKVNKTVFADGVGGEDRDRPGSLINLYDWNMVCFQKDLSNLSALLSYDAKIDTMTQPFECAAAILIYPNNATKVGFEGRELTIDDWDFDGNPGRTERGMLTVPFRTRYFEPVPSL